MPRLVANTADMPQNEWLELRKQGIGGSDASAVAGVNKYANPVTLYMEKVGLYERNTADHVSQAAEWGNRLEPIVRDTFKEKINAERKEKGLKPLKVVHRKAIYAHDTHDFIRTNLDGVIYDSDRAYGDQKGIFEAKTAHYMLRDDWEGEDVPNQYYLQVQHNMLVMNVNYAYLAVLIGGNTYKHYYIERDEEICDYLIQIESTFWNRHIIPRIPPEMNGHDAEKEMVKQMHPLSEPNNDYITTLPDVCIEYVEQIEAMKDLEKTVSEGRTKLENEVKSIMATTEIAYAGPHKITWKTDARGTRRFSIKLDDSKSKDKFYNTYVKEIEKRTKTIEKDAKAIAKEKKALEKQLTKQRKEAEKEALKAEKEAQKKLKQERKELKQLEELQNEKV